MFRLLTAVFLLSCGTLAAAQGQESSKPNGVFLIAKPDLADANFGRTVVLVTQTEDFSTVGVIINRPTPLKLSELEPGLETGKYRDAVFFGGPVMVKSLVAVFLSETRPAAAAFHVLPKLYMTLHPDNVKMLLASEGRRYRLYAGFSGWAPRQLESEFDREGWFVLPADADTVFRADTAGLWEELVERVRALKTRAPGRGAQPVYKTNATPGREAQPVYKTSATPGRGAQPVYKTNATPGRGAQPVHKTSATPGRGAQPVYKTSATPVREAQPVYKMGGTKTNGPAEGGAGLPG